LAERPATHPARRDPPIAAGSASSMKVFTALLTRGAMTRAEIGEATGFSAGAVTKAVQPLLASGAVRELPEEWAPTGAGRPAVPITVDAHQAYVVGVKITADELIGVITDLRAEVIESRRVALPVIEEPGHHAHTVDPDDAVAAVGGLIQTLLDRHPDRAERVAHVGVAVSGDVDESSGTVRFSPLLGWRGISLAERLAAITGLPVSVENDVRALTVAELWFGVGVGCSSFAVVTAGTGVGCGLAVGGELITGARGVSGELGHLPVDRQGPVCHCGGTGCVEAIIGEAALLDRIADVSGQPVGSWKDAVALADGPRGAAVRAVFTEAGNVLGLAIASIANLVGPQRIVLTGEALDAYDLLAESMHSAYAAQCFGAARTELVVRRLQFEHWARGAAALAISRLVSTASGRA
jgi:predicted NBD/HSP70 family sugar kinase